MKIALSGYYGFDNAGDEALLSAITSNIKKLEPEAEFVVFSGFPAKTAKVHGLRAVNRMNPWSVTRELLGADLLISGGGSLFQDVTSPRSLPYYISVVALAKLIGKPVIFYAQGIGPINRRLSRFLMRLIANRVDYITLRDEPSLELLKKIGVMRPPVKVTSDPVFTLTPGPAEFGQMKTLLQGYGLAEEKLVGVAVRPWKALEGYQNNLARVLDSLVTAGYKVLFIPMDYSQDLPESKRIALLMKEPSYIIEESLTSLQHLALIASLKLMIGMRLHALIFAANNQVPFVGISYDPKVDAFLETFDLLPLPTDLPAMEAAVFQMLEDVQIQQRIINKTHQLRIKAEQTARIALSLIRKQGLA
ncbi:MAG: polysaccharide pyruvyl transferase CsaB [Syntrophomonadaceae bacterium]|jgi:polysaccharide pyruvyl transferase CsaB